MMQDLVLSDKFDQAKAEQLAKTMAERQIERRVERQVAMMKDRHDMLNVLTAEQKAQLKQIQADNWQQCQDRMGQGKGPGMGPGPGMGKAKN